MEKTKSRLQTERVTKVIVVCNRLVPGSSPGRTAKQNVILVVQWWWNHLKNLRCIEESGLPRLFWEQEIAGSNPAAPIKKQTCALPNL